MYPDAINSARRVVPVVISQLGLPTRVIDLGGGTGAWCRAFRECGVANVTCIDHPRTLRSELHVAREEFLECDLNAGLPLPIACDLAVSLEVAEHLPPELGPGIVRFLTACASTVLFSAAIPGQPGHVHINERPARYWRELFGACGFEARDIIRPRIICDETVPYWYRQNMLIFARRDGGDKGMPASVPFSHIPEEFELVHERVLMRYRQPMREPGLGEVLRQLRHALRSSLARRLRERSKLSNYVKGNR